VLHKPDPQRVKKTLATNNAPKQSQLAIDAAISASYSILIR